MIQISKEAKDFYQKNIVPLLKQSRIVEATEYLYNMLTKGPGSMEDLDCAEQVLAGLCEMGYAFKGLDAIYKEAFLQSPITKAIIPEGVEEIEVGAFAGCKNLNSVQLPDSLQIIGRCAFQGCKSLTHVEIPEGVEEIEGLAFKNCINLNSIQLPNSLRRIGKGVFNNCGNVILYIPSGFSWENVLLSDPGELNWYEEHSKMR